MKEIHILEEQIAKLENKEFDFRAWKQSAIIILSRIFGNDDQKVLQISKLEMDYSSWSLRDASGKTSQIETIKKLGKEILQTAISELKSYGLPALNSSNQTAQLSEVLVTSLESELKVSQFNELISVINSEHTVELKKAEILKKLGGYDHQTSLNILASILAEFNLKRRS